MFEIFSLFAFVQVHGVSTDSKEEVFAGSGGRGEPSVETTSGAKLLRPASSSKPATDVPAMVRRELLSIQQQGRSRGTGVVRPRPTGGASAGEQSSGQADTSRAAPSSSDAGDGSERGEWGERGERDAAVARALADAAGPSFAATQARLRRATVVGSTCASSGNAAMAELLASGEVGFPIVFLDECSQMTESTSLTPIIRAGSVRALLVSKSIIHFE